MDEKSKVDKWLFYLKNNKYTAPIILMALVVTAIVSFGKNLSESLFRNKDLVKREQTLKDNLDTIKQSAIQYNFAIVNNRFVPTTNNTFYSKNATGVNYGQVGDVYHQTKTYNELQSEKAVPGTIDPKVQGVDNTHTVEIESPHIPIITQNGVSHVAVFSLKTKNKEEANNVEGNFFAVFRNKGVLITADMYGNSNSSVITSYPTEFPYRFDLSATVDTFYIFLKITLKNSIGQPQLPYQVLYQKCKKCGDKPTRLFTGTKEYKEVIEHIFTSSGM